MLYLLLIVLQYIPFLFCSSRLEGEYGAVFSLISSISFLWAGAFVPVPRVYTFEVDAIPDALLSAFSTKGSVHASSILNGSSQEERDFVASWIQSNLVLTLEFDLARDHTVPLCVEKGFKEFSANFEALGFSVWNVENDNEMSCRVKIVQRNDRSRVCDLSGLPDFVITPKYVSSGGVKTFTTKADRLNRAVCIIELQSKHRDARSSFSCIWCLLWTCTLCLPWSDFWCRTTAYVALTKPLVNQCNYTKQMNA